MQLYASGCYFLPYSRSRLYLGRPWLAVGGNLLAIGERDDTEEEAENKEGAEENQH
eukprot:SAG11_NODE_1542_length_4717_cov_2.974881_4_plen_56_part_00